MSRKVLTLSERAEAIKLHDGGKSSRDVAQIMGVGRTQIQQIATWSNKMSRDWSKNQYCVNHECYPQATKKIYLWPLK
jgi:transposase